MSSVKCAICEEPAEIPVAFCNGAHTACYACFWEALREQGHPGFEGSRNGQIRSFRRTMDCPVCKKTKCSLSFIEDDFDLLDAKLFPDDFLRLGSYNCPFCDDVPSDMAKHISECKDRYFPCFFCSEAISTVHYRSHLDEKCDKVACQECKKAGHAIEMIVHKALHEKLRACERRCLLMADFCKHQSKRLEKDSIVKQKGEAAVISVLNKFLEQNPSNDLIASQFPDVTREYTDDMFGVLACLDFLLSSEK